MQVSIIMPYFNKKKFIKASIDSVLMQSFQNFEIIIIYDDINLDDYQFIKNFEKLDNRIKVIKNMHNLGPGLSRNKGIEVSTGKYIAFLDCDDIWEKDKLKYQIDFMLQNKYILTFSSYNIINSKDQLIGSRKAKKTISYNDLIWSCDIGLSTVILKKDVFNDYCRFPDLKTKEDYVLWLKLTQKNQNFFGLDRPLTKWRKLDKSQSSNLLQKMKDGFKVYNNYLKFNKVRSLYHLFFLSLNFLKKN